MSTPLRVAQVLGKMNGYGVENVVMNYYRHIDRSRIQFDFIVFSDSALIPSEEIAAFGGFVYTVPSYQHIFRYLRVLIKLFRKNHYQIVHAHLNTLSVFPLFAAKCAGVPIRIAHSHSTAAPGEWKKNFFKYMLRPFAKVYATHYAACSKLAGEWLFGKKAVEEGQVTIFNNAIDLEKYRFNEEVRNEVREELGLEGKFVVGHVGRFCYQKNQDFVIDIFLEIHKRNPDSALLMIGDGEDFNRIRTRIQAIAAESGGGASTS